MMISTETFYDENLKGKSEREILSVIRSLKQEIGRLKNVMEHPDNAQIILPGREAIISYKRMYLERAKQALADIGGTYTPSQAELRAEKFNANLPFVSRIVFNIEAYSCGSETRTITIEDDKATAKTGKYPLPFIRGTEVLINEEKMDKDSLLKGLADLYIGEWRKEYDPIRFDYISCDGTSWYLTFYYSNGHKPVKIVGYNDYPYNYAKLLEVLRIRLFSIKEFK